MTSASVEPLLYNMQFSMGPRVPDGLDTWQQIKVGDSLYLAAHPNLNVVKTVGKGVSAVLAGYMLDPENPYASNSDILDKLISHVARNDDLFEAIESLGGRWVLIVGKNQQLTLVTDATGLRQVFYTDFQQNDDLWCASQPGHIADTLQLEVNPEAMKFIEWFQEHSPESWWPGDSSHYREIKRLLPNHYLDLKTGLPHRFWPRKPLVARALNDTIDGISGTLAGLMKSAANRFELAVAMSAGWDSRLMLAACKSIARDICYYTGKRPDMEWTHMDVSIPKKLLARLGLPHDIIEHETNITPEFATAFIKNAPFAHTSRLAPLHTELNYYHQKKVGVTGNVSEIARCYYPQPDTPGQAVTAEHLMKVTGMNHPFANMYFNEWIKALGDPQGYDIMDLFYWEQRTGSWFASNCLEFDLTWRDIFIPFNSRSLLMDMLSVGEQDRRAPDYQLYKQLMLRLWPEVLSLPINPSGISTRKRLSNLLRRIVRRLKRLF